jgi:hypothetical protein
VLGVSGGRFTSECDQASSALETLRHLFARASEPFRFAIEERA